MDGDLWQIWLVRGSTMSELVLILLGLISRLPLRACVWRAASVFALKETRLKFNIMLYFINVSPALEKVFNGPSGFIVREALTSSCCSSIVNVPGESTLRRDFLRLQQENKERSEALRRQQLLQEQQLREQEEYKRQLLAERQKRIEQQKEQRRRLEEVETRGWSPGRQKSPSSAWVSHSHTPLKRVPRSPSTSQERKQHVQIHWQT